MQEVVDHLDLASVDPQLVMAEKLRLSEGITCVRQHLLVLEQTAPQHVLRLKTAHASRRVLNVCRHHLEEVVKRGDLDESLAERVETKLDRATQALKGGLLRQTVPRLVTPRELLQSQAWFQALPHTAQQCLVATQVQVAAATTVLTEKGSTPAGVGLIVSGTVSLLHSVRPLSLGAGTLFNLFSYLSARPSVFRVVAESDVRYMWFPNEVLRDLVQAPAAVDALWHDAGVRVAASLLETDLTYATLGREQLLALCVQGHLFPTTGNPQPLWPAFEYILLQGTAKRVLDSVEYHGPCLFSPSSSRGARDTMDPSVLQTKQLETVFELIDRDRSGSVDLVEFFHAIHFMGSQVSFAEAQHLFAKADSDSSGEIDRREFVAVVAGNTVSFSVGARLFAVPKRVPINSHNHRTGHHAQQQQQQQQEHSGQQRPYLGHATELDTELQTAWNAPATKSLNTAAPGSAYLLQPRVHHEPAYSWFPPPSSSSSSLSSSLPPTYPRYPIRSPSLPPLLPSPTSSVSWPHP